MRLRLVTLAVFTSTVVYGDDLAQVRARGTLRVIVAADEAPETFALKPGSDPGFERELLDGFARLQRVKLEPVVAPGYADRIPMLQRGDGDLVAAIFDTPDRRKLVAFTAEVMPTHNVVVTMEPRAAVKSLDELRTMKVGVIKGAKPAEEALKAGLPASALQPYERREALLEALEQGVLGAAILPVSEMAVSTRRFRALRAGVTVGEPGKIAWAVRQSDTGLGTALSDYLGNVRRGPTWSRLVVKYFGDQALVVLGRASR